MFFNPVLNGARQGQYFGNVPGGDEDDSGEGLYSREGSAYASVSSPVILISAAEVKFIIAEAGPGVPVPIESLKQRVWWDAL